MKLYTYHTCSDRLTWIKWQTFRKTSPTTKKRTRLALAEKSSCSVKLLLQCGHAWRIFLLSYTSTSVWTRLENLPAQLHLYFSVDTPGESSCSVTPLLKCGHAWKIFLLSYTSTSVWTRLENLPAQLHLCFSVDTPGESSCSVTPLLQCGHAWRIFLLSYTSTSVWTGPAPGCVWLGTALQRAASRVQSISKVTHAYPATSTYNEGGGSLSISVQRFRLFVLDGHICSSQLYLLVLHYFFFYF